jgi:phosphoenolpyruvate---glycerone phosphotransferase subunit DhaL
MALTSRTLAHGIDRIAGEMEAAAADLNDLDARIGDGDLGVTMVRCARAVRDVLADLPDDVGMALMKCTQAITGTAGSSFATLLASAMMSAAKATRGKTEVPWSDIGALLGDAAEAIRTRGKASPGDKTVLDAVLAAAEAARGKDTPALVLGATADAVDAALDRLRDQPNKVGRARILAEKSIGIDDPGMVAFRRMVKALQAP